jgi:hypothetical protein
MVDGCKFGGQESVTQTALCMNNDTVHTVLVCTTLIGPVRPLTAVPVCIVARRHGSHTLPVMCLQALAAVKLSVCSESSSSKVQ